MEIKETTFAAVGPISGWCGHKHKTYGHAKKCADKHERQCKKVGGYSDRQVEGVVHLLVNSLGELYLPESSTN